MADVIQQILKNLRTFEKSTENHGMVAHNESRCYMTFCPECGESVFFIRHNGGSVWIDSPLGPPWYKHSCFDNKLPQTAEIA